LRHGSFSVRLFLGQCDVLTSFNKNGIILDDEIIIKFVGVTVMKRLGIFLVLFVLFYGLCYGQNTNNERRIIGTWVCQRDNDEWVFSADGTLVVDGEDLKYGITDTNLAILEDERYLVIFNYSFSFDGRTLILEVNYLSATGNSSYTYNYWLRKR
jgi:hypothetical protein